jgi:hypothetical protein
LTIVEKVQDASPENTQASAATPIKRRGSRRPRLSQDEKREIARLYADTSTSTSEICARLRRCSTHCSRHRRVERLRSLGSSGLPDRNHSRVKRSDGARTAARSGPCEGFRSSEALRMSTCDVTCVEPSLLGSATRPTLRNAQLRSAAPNGTVSSAASPSPVLAHGLAARTRESTRPRSVASPLVAGLRTASCCQRQSPPVAKITCGAALRMRTTAGKLTMTRVRMRDLRREFIEGSLCLLGVDGLPTTRIALARQNLCALLHSSPVNPVTADCSESLNSRTLQRQARLLLQRLQRAISRRSRKLGSRNASGRWRSHSGQPPRPGHVRSGLQVQQRVRNW